MKALDGYVTRIERSQLRGETYIIVSQANKTEKDYVAVRLDWLKAKLAKLEKEG